MPSMRAAPLLLGILMILLLGSVAWGFLRVRGYKAGSAPLGIRDDVLVGLLVLAAFGLGIFLAYILLVFGSR